MKKSYVSPSILLLPMQIGPNAGVSGVDKGGMQPSDAKEGPFEEEVFDRNEGFALEAGVNNDVVVVNADDFCGDNFTLLHFLFSKAFCEQIGKGFGRLGSSVGHVNNCLL